MRAQRTCSPKFSRSDGHERSIGPPPLAVDRGDSRSQNTRSCRYLTPMSTDIRRSALPAQTCPKGRVGIGIRYRWVGRELAPCLLLTLFVDLPGDGGAKLKFVLQGHRNNRMNFPESSSRHWRSWQSSRLASLWPRAASAISSSFFRRNRARAARRPVSWYVASVASKT